MESLTLDSPTLELIAHWGWFVAARKENRCSLFVVPCLAFLVSLSSIRGRKEWREKGVVSGACFAGNGDGKGRGFLDR
ncbi:hypothetical protein KY284_003313 [Solanum tuberosum]|nr:hypothetical protein KY284_003313 [Solanum tuberosum]